jgi:hypothetical protein
MRGWPLTALAVLAATAGLAAAGCTSAPPPEAEGRSVFRPALGFAVNVPEGWTWRDLAGDVVLEMYQRIGPAESPSAPAPAETAPRDGAEGHEHPVIHVVVIDREGVTPESWAEAAVEAGREIQSDLEIVEQKPVTLPGGRVGLDVVLRSPRGLEPQVQRLRLVVTDARALAVMATGPESAMKAVAPAVDACFDSFLAW